MQAQDLEEKEYVKAKESAFKRLVGHVSNAINNIRELGFKRLVSRVEQLFEGYDGPTREQILAALKNNKENIPEGIVALVVKRGVSNPDMALVMGNYFMHVIDQLTRGYTLYTMEATPFYVVYLEQAEQGQSYRPQAGYR